METKRRNHNPTQAEAETQAKEKEGRIVNRLTKAQIEDMYKGIQEQAEMQVVAARLQLRQAESRLDVINKQYEEDMANAKEE